MNLNGYKIIPLPSTRIKNLSGKVFGRLTVLGYVGNNSNDKSVWLVICSCENKTIKTCVGTDLSKGTTNSCGCKNSQNQKEKSPYFKLGKHKNRLLRIFSGMNDRCYNESSKDFVRYGKRGIFICSEWLGRPHGFINFYNWALNNGYQENLTIDRIDVNGNYEPNNCRWATIAEQNRNKTTALKVTYNDKEYILKDLVDKMNLVESYDTIKQRIFVFNWSVEDAIHKPIILKNNLNVIIKAMQHEFANANNDFKMKKNDFFKKYNINKFTFYSNWNKSEFTNCLKLLHMGFNEKGDFIYEG